MDSPPGPVFLHICIENCQGIILILLSLVMGLNFLLAIYALFGWRPLERRVSDLQHAAQALIRSEEARLIKERRGNP
jgi:hypothetical protein